MDVYGHLFPGTFGRLVNALDDATIRNLGATAPGAGEASGQNIRGLARNRSVLVEVLRDLEVDVLALEALHLGALHRQVLLEQHGPQGLG